MYKKSSKQIAFGGIREYILIIRPDVEASGDLLNYKKHLARSIDKRLSNYSNPICPLVHFYQYERNEKSLIYKLRFFFENLSVFHAFVQDVITVNNSAVGLAVLFSNQMFIQKLSTISKYFVTDSLLQPNICKVPAVVLLRNLNKQQIEQVSQKGLKQVDRSKTFEVSKIYLLKKYNAQSEYTLLASFSLSQTSTFQFQQLNMFDEINV